MTATVLDTSVVIASGVEPLTGDLAVSAVTLAELHFGVLVASEHATRAERPRRLSILQRQFYPLPVDDKVAARSGRLVAAVVAAWRQPRACTMDLLIAATAHAHGVRLHTQDADDLIGVGDLLAVVQVRLSGSRSTTAHAARDERPDPTFSTQGSRPPRSLGESCTRWRRVEEVAHGAGLLSRWQPAPAGRSRYG